MTTLAIDAGTFNFCAVIRQGGIDQLIRDEMGQSIIPSIVRYKDDGSIAVCGNAALVNYWAYPNVVRCAKRILGMKLNTDDVSDYQKDCVAKVVSGDDNYPRFRMDCFPDDTLTPTMVVQHMIKYVGDLAIGQCNHEIETMIVTVPAFFTQNQRHETLIAAQKANICEKVHIIDEPVAAAYKYNLMDEPDLTKLMVIDFGAGTLDICIMERRDGEFHTIATGGDRCLGGEDITKLLCDSVEEEFATMCGTPLIRFPKQSARYRTKKEALKSLVEEAKKELSSKPSTKVVINRQNFICNLKRDVNMDDDDDDDDDGEISITLTSESLKYIVEPLMDRVEEAINKVLQQANLDYEEMNHVILVGGSARLCAFQECVKSLFFTQIKMISDPDECVARGASLILNESIINKNFPLFDCLPHAYGTVAYSDELQRDIFDVIIPKGTPFPTNEVFRKGFQQVMKTNGEFVDFANVDMFVSEDGSPDNYELYAPYSFTGLSTNIDNIIIISYSIDVNGMISVEAYETSDDHIVFEKKMICSAIGM